MPAGTAAPRPLHPRHGPHTPTEVIAVRRPRSVRRTSTMDNLRPDGVLGPLRLHGRARDLVTDADGQPRIDRECVLDAEIDFTGGRLLTRITSEPHEPRLERLLGARVSAGFRSLVEQAVPDHAAASSQLHLLLDEMPVAALVGGYALGAAAQRDPLVLTALGQRAHKGTPDLCAGWQAGGTIMLGIETKGLPPVVTGPPAPTLTLQEDPAGWHHRPPLPPHSVRRARMLDVNPGVTASDDIEIQSLFRDSHVDETGLETVIHEYFVRAHVDPATLLLTDCVADVRVLPWVECPAAAASAGRLTGKPVAELRSLVRAEFTGVSTCTHLNDQLRSLADVPALLRLLA
jgi:hypothetical protein